MRDRLADGWDTLRNRPLMMIGVMIGVVIFGVIIAGGVTINKRIKRVESHSPCTNLTTRQCAHKLLNALSPAERREIKRRYQQDIARQIRERGRRRGHSSAGRRGSPGGTGSRRPGTPPGSSPGHAPHSPSGGTSPSPPSGTGSPPGGGGGGSSPQPPPPHSIIRTPGIHVPPIGPFPPIDVPPLIVPCVSTAVTTC